jgi:hypothetical protein
VPRVLPLLLLAAACGRELAPQIVKGEIASVGPGLTGQPLAIDRVRATDYLGLAAQSRIDAVGGFLLAVPLGGPYRLELIATDGQRIPLDLTEPPRAGLTVDELCPPIDLGGIHVVPAQCPPGACAAPASAYDQCRVLRCQEQAMTCQEVMRERCASDPDPPTCIAQGCADPMNPFCQTELCPDELEQLELCQAAVCTVPRLVAVTSGSFFSCDEPPPVERR